MAITADISATKAALWSDLVAVSNAHYGLTGVHATSVFDLVMHAVSKALQTQRALSGVSLTPLTPDSITEYIHTASLDVSRLHCIFISRLAGVMWPLLNLAEETLNQENS